jgi:diguanylate cyclase (GGDEF)-like protein
MATTADPTTNWQFERPAIPRSGAVLSLLALAVPVLSSTMLAEPMGEYEALIWLSALIPAFLLAYYRSWRGVALGFATAMVVMTGTQFLVLTSGARLPNWPFMLAITATFIGISLLLGAVVERLHEARAEAERLALYDPLTSLPNRRYVELMLAKDFAAARRGIPLVVVLFDIDSFKLFNDRYGHATGDEALRRLAAVLTKNTRDMNLSGRVGGDEFLSLAAASTVDGALVFVERVREDLRRLPGLKAPINISAGVAAYTRGMTSSAELVAAADRALYRAKQGGRDRVVVAGQSDGYADRGAAVEEAYQISA